MSALGFALPPSRWLLDPTPQPRPAPLKKGDSVRCLVDGDAGEVTGVIPQESAAIRWDSTGKIVWYYLPSIEDRIEAVSQEEEDDDRWY